MDDKDRKRILDNFYIKEMKNGKAKRAYIFDKMALAIAIFFLIFFIIDRFIKRIFISFILTIGISLYLRKTFSGKLEEIKSAKIKKIKKEYREKLIEEGALKEDQDLDDYVMEKYKERRAVFKQGVDIYAKGKALKLYTLAIIFLIASYLVEYSLYYKSMGVIIFILASFIASRKLTEYVSEKDNDGLLDRDIDV